MPPHNGEDLSSLGGQSLTGSDNESRLAPLLESPQLSDHNTLRSGSIFGDLIADDCSDTNSPTYSLAHHPKTAASCRLFVPLLIILTHGLFIWGQTTPMWYLYFGLDMNVTVEAQTFATQQLLTLAGASNPIQLETIWNTTVSHFDYWDAVKTLWIAEGIANKWTTRVGAIVLVLFSGVWPHLKLTLLHLFWWVPTRKHSRTSALYWLGTFGKWSLADVFVVCLLIAVLNLDLAFDGSFLASRIQEEMPKIVRTLEATASEAEAQGAICRNILKLNCSEVLVDWECNLCRYGVGYLYEHPGDITSAANSLLSGLHTSGGGVAALRVAGLFGIYVYCLAVIASLVLSTIVDTIDHRAKAHSGELAVLPDGTVVAAGLDPLGEVRDRGLSSPGAQVQLAEVRDRGLSGGPREAGRGGRTASEGEEYDLDQEFLFSTFPMSAASLQTPNMEFERMKETKQGIYFYIKGVCSRSQFMAIQLMTSALIPVVCFAIWNPTLNRVTKGSVPIVVDEVVGASFDRSYSIATLSHVLADRGGLDYFLQAVFAMFCIVGPISRVLLLFGQLTMRGTLKFHKKALFVLNVLGAVNGWDVMLLAVILINTEMPSITQTILDKNSAFCKALAVQGLPDFCLEVDLQLKPEFMAVVFGGVLLSSLSSLFVKLLFVAMDPYGDGDHGGPYLPKFLKRLLRFCCLY